MKSKNFWWTASAQSRRIVKKRKVNQNSEQREPYQASRSRRQAAFKSDGLFVEERSGRFTVASNGSRSAGLVSRLLLCWCCRGTGILPAHEEKGRILPRPHQRQQLFPLRNTVELTEVRNEGKHGQDSADFMHDILSKLIAGKDETKVSTSRERKRAKAKARSCSGVQSCRRMTLSTVSKVLTFKKER
jgi:hypothetical protein